MEAFTTTRYRCDHCRKSYARKGACASHEAECHFDPAVKACTTCVHFEPGWPLANGCAVDAFPVFDGWDGREQLADFARHCTEWQPKP